MYVETALHTSRSRHAPREATHVTWRITIRTAITLTVEFDAGINSRTKIAKSKFASVKEWDLTLLDPRFPNAAALRVLGAHHHCPP